MGEKLGKWIWVMALAVTAVSTRINWESSPNNDLPPITQTLPTLSLQ